MPWDAPAPQAAQPVSTQPSAAQAPQAAPAPSPQPVAAPASQPATASLADAPAAAQVENITPEFSDILSDLTAVFGTPTKVSVEAANPGPDDADLPYDDEGADAADADSAEFADEPIDDADEDE